MGNDTQVIPCTTDSSLITHPSYSLLPIAKVEELESGSIVGFVGGFVVPP